MNKAKFYIALILFIKSNGEQPCISLFDLHEEFKPSCSLSDVNDLFNEVGTPGNFRIRRRILGAARADILSEGMLASDQWILFELHKLLVPGFPYANSKTLIKVKEFEFYEIDVLDVIKTCFKKLKRLCFGSK